MKKYKDNRSEKIINGPDVFADTYSAELYMKEKPVISEKLLLENIKKYYKNVELASKKDNNITFAFMDHVLEYKNASVPASIIVSIISDIPDKESLENSFKQSWGFENKEAIENSNYRVLVTDIMAVGLDYHERIDIFQKALYAVTQAISCEGIHFKLTEQVIDRQEYLDNNPLNDDYDPLLGILNVRLFTVGIKQNEYIMDTLGLSAVGLCDLQCHFNDLDPNEVSNILYSYGYYIFDNSEAADNLDIVEGINENELWKCSHEVSLIKPERVVLDINPGEGFRGSDRI